MPNAELIKQRMNEKGLSQKRIAEELGIAQPTLCQKVSGKRPFLLSEAEQLADLLGIADADFRLYFLT